MHPVLARQLHKAGLQSGSVPTDASAWSSFLDAVTRAYEQADDDRYLLERSLALSSEEMGELHAQLAAERDTISTVICSLAEGVCAVNRAGAILFANPEAKRLLKLDKQATLTGASLPNLVQARTPDGRTLAALLREAQGSECRLIVNDDERIVITCSIAPLGGANAQSREGLVITLRDVTERTRLEEERADLHRRLLDASRQAGMAEVASGVLHNVGNVLNSVNVSATLASDLVKASKTEAVAKLADVIESNRSRLAEFLTNDPAGARVPEYLNMLAARLEEERAAVLAELAQLRSNVDHIREIVSTQQSFAKNGGGIGGVREAENIAALVEDALRITEAALIRHRVEVERDFQSIPPVLAERHQVLQILINLITNAKKAVSTRAPNDRRVSISVRRADDRVVVRVTDNGVGIAPDDLTHVFQHGFTSWGGLGAARRNDGHGFGLHSAALAAKAMGGSLRAESAGVDQGATFTLEIPFEQPMLASSSEALEQEGRIAA